MRIIACSLLALVACNTGGEGDDYYVEPGGGGGQFGATIGSGSGSGGDGGVDGGAAISGRLCLLTNDLRVWDVCATADLDGYAIKLGAAMSATDTDGIFQIAPPIGNVTWEASSGTSGLLTRDSRIPFGAEPHRLFAVEIDDFVDLTTNNLINPDPTKGDIFVRVRTQGAPLAGAVASLLPSNAQTTLYSAAAATDWTGTATDAIYSIVWFSNVSAGPENVTITPADTNVTPLTVAVPVVAGAVTFATVNF